MNEEDRREPVGEGASDEGRPEAEEQSQATGAPAEQPEADGAPEDQEQTDGQTEAPPEPDAQAEEPPEPDAQAEEPQPEAPPEAADSDAAEVPVPEQPQERQPSGPEQGEGGGGGRGEVVPGADLEPDLVLEQPTRSEGDEYGDAAYAERYADPEPGEEPAPERAEDAAAEQAPGALTPRELAADARYQATGKRKTAVARVILKPGSGAYTVNGSALEQFFPRPTLQNTARQPLTAAGYQDSMDVVARLHGGGVSAQAGALRHGIARALADADPALRGEMKRRGYLTRDPRVKERKKAGLKKARKRPQFSKR